MSLGVMYVGMGSGYQQLPDKRKSTGFCLQHLFLSNTEAGVLNKNYDVSFTRFASILRSKCGEDII
jgi:hypothetical protein